MREAIRFLRGDQIIELFDVAPTETLLDYLRLRERKVGTKEGCNEGDCGACTVALGRLVDGRLVYEPVNACIQLLGQVDGCEVVTIEDLAEGGALHPVQEALARHHGSQCGFCTPGIAMSLFTLYHQPAAAPDRKAVNEALAGNLCRCTGYRPIADAALEVCFAEPDDKFSRQADTIVEILSGLRDGDEIFIGDERSFFASPASIDSLADLYARHPDATLVAGATDVGLWITKQLRELPKIIWLGRVAFLDRVEPIEEGLIIGATASLSRVEPEIARLDPDLGAVWSRIGSKQVRASGTVGGNIANGSPIGDTPPMLIALGATLELRKGDTARTLPLEDYFIDYGRQDRGEAEFVTGLFVPAPGPNDVFRAYKLSKRFDQDISAVMAAFLFTVEDGRIIHARIAFGGMAATPRRARRAEAALGGAVLAEPGTWGRALKAIERDFAPISDMRASAEYRAKAARSLFAKALVEAAGMPSERTRVQGHREAAEILV
ncbi:xanthine dehydrogenase small subunit [Breoghania corrubedonensis]|uniref:Xanthine dehydrogenase small subunit n=1 Tax=Breoghania corrubedonensis TaxID=665038 RepID=A0A2T5V8R5_9HYPH|nr:xanthine dehydrogenase small subunit [Breoghania corrubedonensis]PTW60130.1 xanthine dehydrogenase small subunit [Breoghania corrubedonensis]